MSIDLLLTLGIVLVAAVFILRNLKKNFQTGSCGCGCNGCPRATQNCQSSCADLGQIAKRP
ncbi:MAG: FeoB-associated Cys-rich membrane protein [Spartobacteria bacterium]|nr:FeoB-associated Cys-rich membrane protein [Spartobacteria bacterium]